jgi:hypothetical protein
MRALLKCVVGMLVVVVITWVFESTVLRVLCDDGMWES